MHTNTPSLLTNVLFQYPFAIILVSWAAFLIETNNQCTTAWDWRSFRAYFIVFAILMKTSWHGDVNVMLRQTFWLANRNRLFVLYTISLSSLCKHIWRHIKCPSDIFCRVCKIKHTSQLSMMQYMGLCVFSLRISFVMIERIYIPCLIIIVIKSEVWTIIHCLGLGHETMVCALCLAIFLCVCFWWP